MFHINISNISICKWHIQISSMDSTNLATALYLSYIAMIIFSLGFALNYNLCGACYDSGFLTYIGLINCVFELFIISGILTCTESLLAMFKFIYAVWFHYLVYRFNQPFNSTASRALSNHFINQDIIHSLKTYHHQHYIDYHLVVIALSYIPLNNTNTPMS